MIEDHFSMSSWRTNGVTGTFVKVTPGEEAPAPRRGARRPGPHLPNGRQRVLGGVVAGAAVGDGGDAVAGPQHLQGPARGQGLEAEEAQQEVEDAGEDAGIAGAAGHQQEQQQQEGEGAQEAALRLPQPHAGARTGTDGNPGPAGLPGQESEEQGQEFKALSPAGAPSTGYSAAQWRRRRQSHPEEPAAQPIRAGACGGRGRGHRGAAEAGPAPRLASRKRFFWVILGSGHQPGFQAPEGEGCQSRCTVVRLQGF